ncbi:hypothetical protein, partial [Enterobacter hormaechei]
MEREDDSIFLFHAPCENCGSSDGNSVYSDGHEWCFVCEHRVPANKEREAKLSTRRRTGGSKPMSYDVWNFGDSNGRYSDLTARGISKETCQKAGYWLAKVDN